MGRNIVIFADGTGQRGGVLLDECRSNVYKLYRAARCSPDSGVDPARQHAFYDPGIGTLPPGTGSLSGIALWLYNLVCQATGLGLTGNIVDCYGAIIRHWRPGDQIFLIGFSRGAYTARCVGGVLGLCGVPTRMADGSPLRRDAASARRLARKAVEQVYQHGASHRSERLAGQRQALAARFRERHGSGDAEGPNAVPHFIGVFDTVAAVGRSGAMVLAALVVSVLLGGASAALGWWIGYFARGAAWVIVTALLLLAGAYLATHLKVAFGLPGIRWWRTLHLTRLRMRFHDTQLNPKVGWARHALAIDEHRADFDRVPWGTPKQWRRTAPGEPEWFRQLWFPGNHSDVGGSYPESESRLSDIALGWMADEAEAVPGGLVLDRSVLRVHPDATGPQHDETRGLAFRFARRIVRAIRPDAPLHPSVMVRFAAPFVQHNDLDRPYRPEALRAHREVAQHYPP